MNFTPVVRNSISIAKSLKEFSIDRQIPIKFLDFELVTYETFIKRENAYEREQVEDLKTITKADLLNPATEIYQEYAIKILPLNKERLNPPIKLSISANKLKTRTFITIAKGSLFQKNKNLLRQLKSLIWEKKLRAGIFIDLFESSLNKQLVKLLEVVPYGKHLPKDLKFTVAIGVEPTAPLDAKIEKVYEQNSEKDSLIEGVDKDELILKFHKAKDGKNGRACDGRFIKVRAPKNTDLKPEIDETVYAKDFDEYIEYFANSNGFVLCEKKHLSISKTLQLEGADFKSTGSIDVGDNEKDISVHIAHKKSQSEDAIGSGITIDVKNLNVDGSVGANVNIATEELNVDAQTHKNSKIEVLNNASIKLHRGDLKAANAEIEILETGKVTADESIYIKKMLGGEAIAPRVKVDELLSNSTIIASELIEIKTINGKQNSLIIDPLSIESYHKKLDKAIESLKSAKESLKKNQEKLNIDLKEHSEMITRIQTFQLRVQKAMKAGKKPMKQDVLRVQNYKKDGEKFKERSQELKAQESEVENLKLELKKLEEFDLHSKVMLKTRYDGNTKVIFVNVRTKEKLTTIPEGLHETISLELDNSQERVIKL